MDTVSRPIITTPLQSVEDVRFTRKEDDQIPMMGGRKVANGNHLESFERSGLVAMKEHAMASRSKLSLASSGVKGFFKLLLSFKIAQTIADGAMFLQGRMTKPPFHAKMDENSESNMNDISKGNIADAIKFDPKSYIDCMDQFVLGDHFTLPDDLLQDINTLLVKMVTTGGKQEAIEHGIGDFLMRHAETLKSVSLTQELMNNIDSGNGILTPKILLAKLVRDLKVSGGTIDGAVTTSFTSDCEKVAEYYDQRTAMSLYAKSLSNMQLMEAATKKELSKLDMVRKVLNQSTDFLMSTVPFIYMFVVANLIIDRNASGAVKTERFNEFMDERYGHLPDLQDVKLFAENYFTTNTVDEFGLKWGNALPTMMAISLYFLSTLRLGFNLSSPEKHETFVDQGMSELLNTYRLMLTASDKADGAAVSAGVQPGTEEAAMLRSEGYQPLLQKPETSDTQPIEATEPDESEPLTDAHSPNANTPPQTTTEGDFVTVNLEDIASQPDHLKSAAIARAYFNTLSGSRESKLEVVYKFFSGGLIGVRAMNNVAFEGKDATPDTEKRDWFYNYVCSKIIIPLSAIENRGVIDEMMSQQEKSRVIGCLGKLIDGQELTAEEEDFMKGVMGSWLGSRYGFAKQVNSALTAVFMLFHLGVLFADFITAVRHPDGKSVLDPLFKTSVGLMDVGLIYKLFYRPALEVLNIGTFAMQHGWKNISRYFLLAAWNVIGRSVTSAPALPLWNLNTTNTDTMATLVDSAGTTGHDQSTFENLEKAARQSDIEKALLLLHIFVSNPSLWSQAFPNTATEQEPLPPLPTDDFSGFLSQRLDRVANDMELFTQMKYALQPTPVRETAV